MNEGLAALLVRLIRAPYRFGRVVVVGRGERHHQHLAGDLGDHQPVRRWFGWIEQRVGVPDFVDVVDAEGVVFEQMGGLLVDLKRIGVIQPIEIEQLTHQPQCITNGYKRRGVSPDGLLRR